MRKRLGATYWSPTENAQAFLIRSAWFSLRFPSACGAAVILFISQTRCPWACLNCDILSACDAWKPAIRESFFLADVSRQSFSRSCASSVGGLLPRTLVEHAVAGCDRWRQIADTSGPIASPDVTILQAPSDAGNAPDVPSGALPLHPPIRFVGVLPGFRSCLGVWPAPSGLPDSAEIGW